MSKTVGVDVKINLPSKNEIMNDLKSKWSGVKDSLDLKVNVRADKNSLNKMGSQIKSFFDGREFGVDIKVDLKHGERKLKEFTTMYHDLRKEFDKGLELKFNPNKTLDKSFRELISGNSKKMQDANAKNGDYIKAMMQDSGSISKVTQQTIREQIKTADNAVHNLQKVTTQVNAFKKEIVSSMDGEVLKKDVYTDKIAGIKAVIDYTKEIGRLERENLTASEKVVEANKKVIDLNKQAINGLKQDYKNTFGEDMAKNMEVVKAEAAASANVEMQKALIAKERQAQIDKERQATVSKLVEYENEMYRLAQKKQNAGDQESAVYDNQISKIQRKSDALKKQSGIMKEMTREQKSAYDSLVSGNKNSLDFSTAISKAAGADKTKLNEQKQALQDLKRDLKEIQKLEVKSSEIQAKAKAGGATAKENDTLRMLEAELKVRRDIYEQSRKEHSDSGKLTSSGKQELESLNKQYDATKKIARARGEQEASIRQEQAAYSSLEASIKKVATLKRDLGKAGSKEASYIKEVISAEQEKQQAIERSLSSQKSMNKARQDELNTLRKESYAKADEDANRSRLAAQDSKSGKKKFSSVVNIDPIRVAQEAKQAFMVVYDSVAKVDEQLVNIQKVADVPATVLQKFNDGLYDQAAAVGKSADAYAESVARWLTTGKSLEESDQLAKVSVMGSFVGNIEEDKMVDYMAVPLNAYKNSALEATDVINAMNEVSNNNAAEMEHLGAAYSRAASTAATAGTSFSELTGMITAGQEATRAGGEKIGTALRAIDINFGKMSSGMTDADKARTEWFSDRGIALKDENNELRSTYDILNDLSSKWGELSGDDRTVATTYAAGKNHAAILQGIVQNWKTAEKATKEAQSQVDLANKESGSAFEEFAKQQDSVQYKTAALTNAWQEFLNTISGGREGVNGVLDILTSGLQKANELVQNDKFMDFMGNLLKIGGAVIGLKAINKGFSGLGNIFSSLATNVGIIGGGLSGKGLLGNIPLLSKGGGKLFNGMAGGLTTVIGLFGKFVPWLNIAMLAMAGLEMMGVDVFGGLAKVINDMGGGLNKTKRKVKEYRTEQEKLNEAVSDGLDSERQYQKFQGEKKELDKLIESKKKAIEQEKELAKQEGRKPKKQAVALTDEEFVDQKKAIENLAGEYGLDITVDSNNLDEVLEKMALVEKTANRINQEKVEKLNESVSKSSKYTGKDRIDEIKSDYEPTIGSEDQQEKDLALWNQKIQEGTMTYKEMADNLSQRMRENMYTTDQKMWDSKDAKLIEEENQKRMSDMLKQRDQLVDASKDGVLPKNLNKESVRLMASEIQSLTDKKKQIDGVNEAIKNGLPLTQEQHQLIKTLDADGKYQNITNETSNWGEKTEEITQKLKNLKEEMNKTSGNVENSIRERAKDSLGLEGKDLDEFLNSMKGAKADYVRELADWGEQGASILGASQQFLERTGENWGEVLGGMQEHIDKLSSEDKKIAIDFGFVDNDGFANIEKLDDVYNLPEAVQKQFGLVVEETGEIDVGKTLDFVQKLQSLDDETLKKFDIEVGDDGILSLNEINDVLAGLDANEMKELMVTLGVDDSYAMRMIAEISGMEITPEIVADASKLKDEMMVAGEGTVIKPQVVPEVSKDKDLTAELAGMLNKDILKIPVVPEAAPGQDLASLFKTPLLNNPIKVPMTVDGSAATTDLQGVVGVLESTAGDVKVVVKADGETAEQTLSRVKTEAIAVDEKDPNVLIMADGSKFHTVASGVETKVTTMNGSVVNITFKGVEDASLTALKNLASSGITVHGKGSKSVAAGIAPSIASSMSVGANAVGKAMNVAAKSMSKTTSSSSRSSTEKIDSDIWRYWSKELFTGLPIENSLDKLKTSIDQSKENEVRLISLYKQQISLYEKQIRYEKDMQKAKQSELNSVLSSLRKQGFQTSGNNITNLGHAKNIKGEDNIKKANENLTKYRDLYNQINDINMRVLSLQADKWDANQDIKEAEKSKESKDLEKRFRKTEALLTAIKNNTDILDKKLALVGDGDFELKMTLNEEAANASKKNIEALTNEFNALSKMYVKNKDNAADVQSQLESLRDEIVSNADAILDYQEAIRDLKIDRLNSDLEKFSTVMSSNIDKIEGNIDRLKDGLLSGTSFKDLESSNLDSLNLSRKTQLEKQFEERLSLEAKLNEALDGYAKKNVDRTAKVANSILTVEKNKYQQLLKMQSDFSNGKTVSATAIKPADVVGKKVSEKGAKESAWANLLVKINNEYSKVYASMSSKYDAAMKNAKTQTEKDALTNQFVIQQLKLQEEMYKKIIVANREASAQANEMLKDTGLTTAQREELEDSLASYKEAIIDAQDAIKDAVQSRYDLEFDLIDELTDKAASYSKELDQLLSIQEAVSNKESDKTNLLQSIYDAKINEYATARKSLQKLTDEQSKVEVGSFEWKLLKERIDEVRESMRDLTIDILDANKELMNNRLSVIQEGLEKGMFNGQTLEQWEKFTDNWFSGIEKEIELDKIRRKAIDLETSLYDKKIEALDRQEAVSKKDLEYLDKQMSVLELQQKLDNVTGERSVQTLAKNEDGTWDWQYVADQTEIDKVKEDLEKAELELQEFKQSQRKEYFSDLSDIVDKAKDGGFDSSEALAKELAKLKEVYGFVLDDIPEINTGDLDSIISAYDDYLKANKDIVSGIKGENLTEKYEGLVENIGVRFEEGFRNIADELGEAIGKSLRNAIKEIALSNESGGYVIQKQVLEFPNVTDTTGFREILETLPAAAKQAVKGKE